jgi:hypothetical protein
MRKPVIGENPETGNACFGYIIEDTFIFDPKLSTCGRFDVDPYVAHGLIEPEVAFLKTLNDSLQAIVDAAAQAGIQECHKQMALTTRPVVTWFGDSDNARGLYEAFSYFMLHEFNL